MLKHAVATSKYVTTCNSAKPLHLLNPADILKAINLYLVDPGETVETTEDLEITDVAVISEAQTDCSTPLSSCNLPALWW